MRHRLLFIPILLLALGACGREASFTGSIVSPTPEFTPEPIATELPTTSPTATELPEATSTPQATPSPAPTQQAGGNAGIDGSVRAGPTCPVESASSPCPDRAVPDAEVTAKDESGNVAGRTVTDANGRFTMRLAPGTYRVTAKSATVESCETEKVDVIEHHYTPVIIDCDTGIR